MAASDAFDLVDGFLVRPSVLVGPNVRESIVHVGQCDNPARHWDLVAFKVMRVARAVPLLMVMQGKFSNLL